MKHKKVDKREEKMMRGTWSCEEMKIDVDAEDQTRMQGLRLRGGNSSSVNSNSSR